MHMSVHLTWLKLETIVGFCQPKILINHNQDRYIHGLTQDQLSISKIDQNNHILWQQQYNDVSDPKYQLMMDPNIDALYLIYICQQKSYLIVSKLDANGHLIWSGKTPPIPPSAYPPNGGWGTLVSPKHVIIDGSFLYIATGQIGPFKLDADGQTVGSVLPLPVPPPPNKGVEGGGYGGCPPTPIGAMILDHDKNLYLADLNSPINVVKIDQHGQLAWVGHHPVIKTQMDQSTLTMFFNDQANLSLGFISNDLNMGRNYVHYYVFNLNGHLIIDLVRPIQYMDPFVFPHNRWIYHLSKKIIHQINVVDGSEKSIEINGALTSLICHDHNHNTTYLASLNENELTVTKHDESMAWTLSSRLPDGSCLSHMILDHHDHLILLIYRSQSQTTNLEIGLLMIDPEMMGLVDLETHYQLQNTRIVLAGEAVHYTFSIKNRSKTSITHVMINDTLTGSYTLNGSIESNESQLIHACYRLTQEDLDGYQNDPYYLTLVNRVMLCYENQNIRYQQEYRPEMYTIGLIYPSIELTTSSPILINSCNQSHKLFDLSQNQQKEFMFTLSIKNTGNITIKKIWVDDSLLGMSHHELLGRSKRLFPNQQLSYTLPCNVHQLTSDHLKHKVIENKATLNALTVHETYLTTQAQVIVISCIFPNTMVTLSDGRQVMVQNLQKGDIVYPNRVVQRVYERPVINEMLEVVIFEPHCFGQQPDRQLIMTGDYMIYQQGKKKLARKFQRQNGVHLVYHFAKRGTLYDIQFVEHGSYWAHGMELLGGLGGHPP